MIRYIREINCLACGRDLGRIETAHGETRRVPAIPTLSTAEAVLKPGRGLVCGRCGGRALVGPRERVFTYTSRAQDHEAPEPEHLETQEAA